MHLRSIINNDEIHTNLNDIIFWLIGENRTQATVKLSSIIDILTKYKIYVENKIRNREENDSESGSSI